MNLFLKSLDIYIYYLQVSYVKQVENIIIIINLKLAIKKFISYSVVECFSAFSVLSEMFCMSL